MYLFDVLAGGNSTTKNAPEGLNVLTQMQMLNSTGQAGSIAVVPGMISTKYFSVYSSETIYRMFIV